MLGTIVDYMHNAHIPFRLASYPSEEALPIAAHRIPAGGMLVDTLLVKVDGTAVLAVFPAGESVDLGAVSASLGGTAVAGATDDLPVELARAGAPVPPLGQLFGLPLVLDERVTRASVLVFRALAESLYFEVSYDDFARLEQPRVASFASRGGVGELGAATPSPL
jgi:Ala-tRNA(Pro) deacylase